LIPAWLFRMQHIIIQGTRDRLIIMFARGHVVRMECGGDCLMVSFLNSRRAHTLSSWLTARARV